ncbi:uncharacterized protein LOC135833258 isoform X1 [Planococcus citri]|uniref:uncharacterized protein LOC135833258 isoform X1 n=1 Tax=Planococcus citri TaxID=170843 RepID=UPI0031F72F08
MNVLNDIVKIVNQIRGKQNIFEYKSTIANQFYLVYCFLGEIYFSTTFHRHTKIFLFSWQISGFLAGCIQPVSYLFYGGNEDAAAFLYTIFVIMIIVFCYVLVPYTSVIRYRSDLLDAIQIANHIIMKRELDGHKTEKELNLGKWIKHIVLYNCLTISVYSLICCVSVSLFYEEEKVKNHIYYHVHPPRIEQYGSLSFFLIFSIVTNLAATSLFLILPMISFIFAFCGIVFHNEIQKIIEDLNSLSSDPITIESYKSMQPKFKNAIIKCVKDYQRAIKMIECFRGFYESLAAFILPCMLYIQVAHAFFFVSPNISITVRMRELSVFLSTIQWVFVLCWTGSLLDDSAEALSFAVYSTPWYWSTLLRKDVYILLRQTQRPISARALGVYPLCLATFLQFMNVIQSSVNVLRKITSK